MIRVPPTTSAITAVAAIASFEILTTNDAVDAVELSRPEDFESGLLVLFLDDEDWLLGGLAVRRAPANTLTRIVELLLDARLNSPADSPADSPAPRFSALIVGVVRPGIDQPTVDETSDWQEAQHLLAAHGVALAHLVTVSKHQWSTYLFEEQS
jgi:hypothetical protein